MGLWPTWLIGVLAVGGPLVATIIWMVDNSIDEWIGPLGAHDVG